MQYQLPFPHNVYKAVLQNPFDLTLDKSVFRFIHLTFGFVPESERVILAQNLANIDGFELIFLFDPIVKIFIYATENIDRLRSRQSL